MKRLFFSCCFFTNALFLFGQNTQMAQSTRDAINFGQIGNFNPNSSASMIYGISDTPGEVIGEIYLDSSFLKSSIVFYREIVKRYDSNASDSIAGYPVRIDLRNYLVEFKLGEAVKSIDPLAIRKVYYQRPGQIAPSVFWNVDEFNDRPDDLKGFVEMLAVGKLKVVKSYSLLYIRPTYNAALSVGDKNAKYFKRYAYYYADAKSNLIKFKPKRKELLALMADKASLVIQYINEKKLTLDSDEEIKMVLNFYNKLVDM
jgi:hypothetical protein